MEKDIPLRIEIISSGNDDRYGITAPKEIELVLHQIADKGSRIALYYGDARDFILTTLLGVNDTGLWLEQSQNSNDNRRITESRKLVFVSSHLHIKVQTTAIMPVHCYGHPCDVDAIQAIAEIYNLRVIYDAAHAFGVQSHSGSVLNHGDLSVLSFHSTKVFNTFEGGAIICPDEKTKLHIDHLKNFGFVDEVTVVAPGINGKMSEINAAFGMLQLKGIDEALQKRKAIDIRYRTGLAGVKGIHCLHDAGERLANYAYFTILVQPDYPLSRDALYQKMHDNGVYARRYFYPLISDFPMHRGMPSAAHANLPVARRAASEVICLPIYPDLSNEQVDFIVKLVAG